MKVGLIGFGAIGRGLCKALAERGDGIAIVGALTRSVSARAQPDSTPGLVTADWAEFMACEPDVVVECASHQALREYGRRVLGAGRDLVIASAGALADDVLFRELRAAALRGRSCMVIPAGAAGGLDILGAARRAGLDDVRYTSRKRPRAWMGTAAEGIVDLSAVTAPEVFFEGNARSAALAFPQNANVVATIAIAGIGFERTRVALTVDPNVPGNRHVIEARGAFGELSISVTGRVMTENPKTSMLAPFSLARAVLNRFEAIVI